MRLTKHRKEILAQLDKHHATFSASEIHEALPHINLVTIYRSLDLLVKENLIKKLNLGKTEACYEIQKTPHHHALCNNCDRVIHFSVTDEKLKKQFSIPDFDIENIEIVVRGSCGQTHKN